MDRESANATRLRVNRIALIQQLDTQELVPKLVRARIISADYDVPHINQGTSRIDRARRLVECLLTPTVSDKEYEYGGRPRNWFLQFRSILQENSSIYSDLVTALDNTVIRTPDFAQRTSQAFADQTNVERAQEFRQSVNQDLFRVSQPRQDDQQKKSSNSGNNNQEQITKIEFDRYAMNKILIEGSFQKVVDNLTYHSQAPEHLFEQLSQSVHPFDREQLRMEKQAFDDMRRLELMNNLIRKERSLANQTIYDTPMVDAILSNPVHHHLFYKYFTALSSIYGVHYDREFLQAYIILLEKKDLSIAIEKGFQLYEFLYGYGRYELCRQVIERIIQMLTKHIKQQQPPIWTHLFRACCALIQVHNQTLEMKEAWARIEAANEIAENLKATGIEISPNDYAWLYSVASQTAYEDANFDACLQYGYRGLKLADKNNHLLIVDLLCSLAQGLTSKWIMNKAQATAVMAVQYAAKYCGRNSPKYVHALQQLVQYANEFIQDASAVKLAQYAFERARTVYGYESLAVAHCHRALSKSLITLASAANSRRTTQNTTPDNVDDDDDDVDNNSIRNSPPSAYLHHAHEAYRIAQDWFGVEDRVRLFPFKMTLAHALQVRSAANLTENLNSHFDDAMELLNDCLALAQDLFGTMSFKVAQVHRLRAATYLSKKMYIEAEQQLQTCMQIYKLCLPPNSFHYLVTKASLGLLYKQQCNYVKALPLFQSIAESLDTKTQSFRWINMVLESLIECYSRIEPEEGKETDESYKIAADKVREELHEWRRSNVKRIDLMQLIEQEPHRNLHQFVHDSTRFQEATDRVHALMHSQQKAKGRTTAPPTTHTKKHHEF